MAINGLMTRRSFLLSESPPTLITDLIAIDRSLKLLGFIEDPQMFMPRQRNKRVFVRGEMMRLIRGVLRDADKPMSSREITLAVLNAKGFDMSDTKRVNQITSRVYKALVRECGHGRVVSKGKYPRMFYTNIIH